MEQLLRILQEMKPGVDFAGEDNLVDDGILDSLEIMTLVVELCDEFDVEISPLDIVPENFHSAQSMYQLIERLQDEA